MWIVEMTFADDPSIFENERVLVGPFSTSAEAIAWTNAVPDQDDLLEINVYYMNAVSPPSGGGPENWLEEDDRVLRTGHAARRVLETEEDHD
jgi:hypothetical protein